VSAHAWLRRSSHNQQQRVCRTGLMMASQHRHSSSRKGELGIQRADDRLGSRAASSNFSGVQPAIPVSTTVPRHHLRYEQPPDSLVKGAHMSVLSQVSQHRPIPCLLYTGLLSLVSLFLASRCHGCVTQSAAQRIARSLRCGSTAIELAPLVRLPITTFSPVTRWS
jgi:hypothetical protein